MRTLQLDSSGNKNQDRSIQPSAIVGELAPFALAPPTPAPRNNPPPNPPPANPPANPGGGTTVSAPNPDGPAVTLPPTSTLSDPPASESGMAMAVAAALAVTAAAALLGLRRAVAKGGSTRDERRRS